MVRETKTLGQGDVDVPEPRHLPTVRNIVVYDSSRQVENWELMWVAQQVCDADALHYWLLTFTDFIPRKDYQEIEKEYKDTVEKTYRLMLRWKREETNGLLQLKNLAEKLRSIRHPEIAEQLEP